jgi:hypothetical protein
MSLGWRLGWIIVIAIGSAFATGLMLAAVESLVAMLRGPDP